jgi:hypothetical protein
MYYWLYLNVNKTTEITTVTLHVLLVILKCKLDY